MKVDVSALLRKIDAVVEIREEYVLRQGAWLVDRWWQLRVAIDPQFRYRGQDRWLPGISVSGRDRQGRFGQFEFRLFDEVTDANIDLPRVEAFLEQFAEARRQHALKRQSKRQRCSTRKPGDDAAKPQSPEEQ